MATQERIKEANFVRNGYDSKNMKNSGCGYLPCDHSEIVRVQETGEEYRYCDKLGMRVSDSDTCKYHQSKKYDAMIDQWLGISNAGQTSTQEVKKEGEISVFRIILVIIACALFLRFLK